MAGTCDCGNELSGSIKCEEYRLAGNQLLCSMELVIKNVSKLFSLHILTPYALRYIVSYRPFYI